jgi:phosphoglycolate phosphatase
MSDDMLFAFDFDGVILDSFDHNIALMNRAADAVGLPNLFSRKSVESCSTMTWEFVAQQCGVPDAVLDTFLQELVELLLKVAPKTTLFDGISSVLKTAGTLGRVVIVTSNHESLVRDVLLANGLESAVERIYGAETSPCKTEKLRLAAQQFSMPLEQTVKIGDCVSDIEHAHEAGTRSIAVTWGFHTTSQLAAAKPGALVHSPKELETLLRSYR